MAEPRINSIMCTMAQVNTKAPLESITDRSRNSRATSDGTRSPPDWPRRRDGRRGLARQHQQMNRQAGER